MVQPANGSGQGHSHNDKGTSPTPDVFRGVSPDVFRLLLRYIYGQKISDDDIKSHSKELLNAADRFGVVNLKLEVEAYIVEDTAFTMESVRENLLTLNPKTLPY